MAIYDYSLETTKPGEGYIRKWAKIEFSGSKFPYHAMAGRTTGATAPVYHSENYETLEEAIMRVNDFFERVKGEE